MRQRVQSLASAAEHFHGQAIVLAAGRGRRMRPLTDRCPKPLLKLHGKPLMQWHMQALLRGGFARQVVNTAWLGQQIVDYFSHQHGAAYCVRFSREDLDFGHGLETAGGIVRALPLLDEIFWGVAGDIYAPGFPFTMRELEQFAQSEKLAHLWLVPNPAHNPRGDFLLRGAMAVDPASFPVQAAMNARLTFSAIALYRRALFEAPWCNIPAGNPHGECLALAALLRTAMRQGQVSAALYSGTWADVGTPQRLEELNACLKSGASAPE